MEIRPLKVPHAYEIRPQQFTDHRGLFTAPFQSPALAEAVGHTPIVEQANVSVSRRGAFRGIHYADVPRSQAKCVTAVAGSFIDFVVDLRAGSPTFGQWDSVLLDTEDRKAVYVPQGMGHALFALEDQSSAIFLCSAPSDSVQERGLNPLDTSIGLAVPDGTEPVVSQRDASAPSLWEALQQGLLPDYTACLQYCASLR